MNRRELIKAMGSLTLGSITLGSVTMSLSQATLAAQSSGRYWVFVSAGGGWDVTNWWDPKGSEVTSAGGRMTNYPASAIRSAGNIRYAAVPEHVETNDMLHTFTQKHYRNMMVMNGVDQGTNGHRIGARVSTSGLKAVGSPVFPALVAAPYASSQSMAYIHQDGNSETAGLVAKTKILSKTDYEHLATTTRYLDSAATTEDLIQKKRAILSNLIANETAGNSSNAMSTLRTARESSDGLNELLDMIPGDLSSDSKYSACEIAAAAFKSGIATSASFKLGSFDSHSDNDQRQFSQMDGYLSVVDHLLDQLEHQGVADQTTVVLCSDMGRKPYYHDGGVGVSEGKGHWPISSMVFMGAGVSGNTVVGGTDDNLRPIKLNANTLNPDENGIALTSESIHNALRRMSGLSGSVLDEKYPISGPFMNLFA